MSRFAWITDLMSALRGLGSTPVLLGPLHALPGRQQAMIVVTPSMSAPDTEIGINNICQAAWVLQIAVCVRDDPANPVAASQALFGLLDIVAGYIHEHRSIVPVGGYPVESGSITQCEFVAEALTADEHQVWRCGVLTTEWVQVIR